MQLCICVFNTGDALNTKTCLIQQVPYDETEDVLLAYICDRSPRRGNVVRACVLSSVRPCTLCNRALRMVQKKFLQHSKESRGVLGQASKQAGKGKERSREGRKLPREGRKEASMGAQVGAQERAQERAQEGAQEGAQEEQLQASRQASRQLGKH